MTGSAVLAVILAIVGVILLVDVGLTVYAAVECMQYLKANDYKPTTNCGDGTIKQFLLEITGMACALFAAYKLK